MKKKILLIGANGFLGKNIYNFFKTKYNIIKFNKVTSHRKDIRILKDLIYIKTKHRKFDFIINLSGQISHNSKKTKSENLIGIKNLIKIFDKNEKIIFFSSSALNNIKKYQQIAPNKRNYLNSKLKSENLIINSPHNYFIIRLGNVYNSNFSKRGLTKNLILHFMENKKITMNNLNEINNYIHINDFLLIFKKILKKNIKKKKFDLSTETYTNKELFKLFKAHFDREFKTTETKNTYNGKKNKINIYKPAFTIKKILKNLNE